LSQSAKSPISILEKAVRKHISIFLKVGLEYRGRIVNFDSYMNIVLKDVEEYNFDTHSKLRQKRNKRKQHTAYPTIG
jgi:small nuclear ribonucleoprotein (snRNP)-like protein